MIDSSESGGGAPAEDLPIAVLQSLRADPAGPALVAATMAAVDADLRQRGRWRSVVSHAGVALLGAAAAAAAVLLWWTPRAAETGPDLSGARKAVAAHASPNVEASPEVTRTVVVERPIYRFVPQEVERVVERIVEKVVEVERVVVRQPLLRLPEAASVAAVFDQSLQSLGRASRHALAAWSEARAMDAASRRAETPSVRQVDPARPEFQLARARAATARAVDAGRGRGEDISAHLRVHRQGGRVILETSGTIEQLFPLLLSRLDSRDSAIAEVVDNRLARLQAVAMADPALAPHLVDVRPNDGPEEDSFEHWNRWWLANSSALVARGVGSESP